MFFAAAYTLLLVDSLHFTILEYTIHVLRLLSEITLHYITLLCYTVAIHPRRGKPVPYGTRTSSPNALTNFGIL